MSSEFVDLDLLKRAGHDDIADWVDRQRGRACPPSANGAVNHANGVGKHYFRDEGTVEVQLCDLDRLCVEGGCPNRLENKPLSAVSGMPPAPGVGGSVCGCFQLRTEVDRARIHLAQLGAMAESTARRLGDRLYLARLGRNEHGAPTAQIAVLEGEIASSERANALSERLTRHYARAAEERSSRPRPEVRRLTIAPWLK